MRDQLLPRPRLDVRPFSCHWTTASSVGCRAWCPTGRASACVSCSTTTVDCLTSSTTPSTWRPTSPATSRTSIRPNSWSPSPSRTPPLFPAGARPPLFPANPNEAYSNTNYVLLGLIVERIAGRSIGAELSRRIFRPLRLRDTFFATGRRIPGPHAHGYFFPDPGTRLDTSSVSPTHTWAAGAIVSTADQVARFYRALLFGRLLRTNLLRAMTTFTDTYGLGILLGPTGCGPNGCTPARSLATTRSRRTPRTVDASSSCSPPRRLRATRWATRRPRGRSIGY